MKIIFLSVLYEEKGFIIKKNFVQIQFSSLLTKPSIVLMIAL